MPFIFSVFSAVGQTPPPPPPPPSEQDATAKRNAELNKSITILKEELGKVLSSLDSLDTNKIEETIEQIGEEIEVITERIEEKMEEIEEEVEARNAEKDAELAEKDAAEMEEQIEKDIRINVNPNPEKKRKDKGGRRTKFYSEFAFGLNGWQDNSTTQTGIIYPEISNWESWFFEAGGKFRTRLGGEKSPISLHYGLTYRGNSFSLTDDYQLQNDESTGDKIATFQPVVGNTKNTILRVGYLTLPLQVKAKLGKKGSLGVGGYVGYRVLTNQQREFKANSEKIREIRRDSYGANNLMYGVSASIGLKNVSLVGKYDLSNLFNENNKNYTFNLYSVGVSFGL